MSVLLREMADFPNELEHKPYMRLRKMTQHRWGSLRMWPKWKSLKKLWCIDEKEYAKTIEQTAEKIGEEIAEKLDKGEMSARTRQTEMNRDSERDHAGRDSTKEGCERCGDTTTIGGWNDVAWRPVVSYANHHLKHLLGMSGKWAIFVTLSLGLGDYAGDPREVTEDVHRFNSRARTGKQWREMRTDENRDRRRRAGKNRREERRWMPLPRDRKLEMKVMDLKSFFIKVPRKLFIE